jgi:hypothetical protein
LVGLNNCYHLRQTNGVMEWWSNEKSIGVEI